MRGNDASTNKRWNTVKHTATLIGGGLSVGALLIALTFAVIRLRDTYVLETRVNQLDGTVQNVLLQRTVILADLDARLDLLERAMFGDIIPKMDRKATTQPESRLEALLLQNDKELRERIQRLERWRLGMID